MKKKSMLAVGACSLMVLGTVVPMTSASAANGKGSICHDGKFFVVHQGDTVNGYSIPQGYYKTYVRKLSCENALVDLHNWLGTDETIDGWEVIRGNRGARSIMFKNTMAKNEFFQIKRLKNQPAQ